MRLREFYTKESVGNTDAIGGALASASGKVAGMVIDYVNKYYDWVKEKKLKQTASKMKPKEKTDAKKIINKNKAKQLDLFDK